MESIILEVEIGIPSQRQLCNCECTQQLRDACMETILILFLLLKIYKFLANWKFWINENEAAISMKLDFAKKIRFFSVRAENLISCIRIINLETKSDLDYYHFI